MQGHKSWGEWGGIQCQISSSTLLSSEYYTSLIVGYRILASNTLHRYVGSILPHCWCVLTEYLTTCTSAWPVIRSWYSTFVRPTAGRVQRSSSSPTRATFQTINCGMRTRTQLSGQNSTDSLWTRQVSVCSLVVRKSDLEAGVLGSISSSVILDILLD